MRRRKRCGRRRVAEWRDLHERAVFDERKNVAHRGRRFARRQVQRPAKVGLFRVHGRKRRQAARIDDEFRDHPEFAELPQNEERAVSGEQIASVGHEVNEVVRGAAFDAYRLTTASLTHVARRGRIGFEELKNRQEC